MVVLYLVKSILINNIIEIIYELMSWYYVCYDILFDILYIKMCYSFILLIILYVYWFNILLSNYREFNVYDISEFCFNYFFWFYWICIGWGICDYDVIFF